MKILISDIAKKAKVSSGTVSNALNNRKGISEEKKQMIIKIAEEMGYFKQKDDKEMSKIRFVVLSKKGNIVGDTPFFSELIRGIELESRELGYELMISHLTIDKNIKKNANDLFGNGQESGTLLLCTELEKEDLFFLDQIKKPFVLIDTIFRTQIYDFVAINNVDASYEIVRHMISNHHKKIGIINSKFQMNNFRERKKGYLQVLTNHNLEINRDFEVLVEPTLEGAYRDMKAYLTSRLETHQPLPQAFFSVNDIIAVGAMRALKEFNLLEQTSVTGFDDIPLAEFSTPSLTTVRVDKQSLGRQSVRRLNEKIKDENLLPVKVLLSTKLIERESVKKVNKVEN
ncbi:LacI family DNA-binding transcriptional regulator [Vagococcus sp.]|uniref:LacI family DNA-binding transcriptional regulator n=1 Tax=Vagococcus sp. TaxID=1933889 RepID=UPI003F97E5B7